MGATQAIDVLAKQGIQDVKIAHSDSKVTYFKFPYQVKEFWGQQKEILQKVAAKDYDSSEQCVKLIQNLTNMQIPIIKRVKLISFFELIQYYQSNQKLEDVEESKQSPSITQKSEEYIFKKLIPFIAEIALKQEEILQKDFPNGLPILIRGKKDQVTMNRQQAACILACMFLNITEIRPHHVQSADQPHSLQEETNAIQFMTLDFNFFPHVIHKYFCLLNYFKQIKDSYQLQKFMQEKITIKRQCPTPEEFKQLSVEFWQQSQTKLMEAEVFVSGRIQDCPIDKKSEVDFANKFIGGLSMGSTYTQQDIIFDTAPQCIVSMLNCERMCSNEAIVLSGVNRYSDYTGYGNGFKFVDLKKGQNADIPREVIAIDALHFLSQTQINSLQWMPNVIIRQLNKAFIGFNGASKDRAISTGKWGCGVFQGDVQLKFLIQWMAASQSGHEMFYYGFGDKALQLSQKVVEKFKGKTIGELFRKINQNNKTGIFDKLI